MKTFLQNALLLAVSTAISLLFVEAAFRVYSKATEDKGLEALNRPIDAPPAGQPATLGSMVQLSANEKIVYEFIPDISVSFMGAPVSINSNGFRGPMTSIDKPGNVRRIVGIGDSVMFGWGVKEQDSYLSILQKKLNAPECPSQWDVINTAVPGYNTAMEIAVLEEKGLPYQPDIVILGFVLNDFYLPRFIRTPTNYFALNRSFVLEKLIPSGQSENQLEQMEQGFARAGKVGHVDLTKVPPEYHFMVGIDGVVNSLDRLNTLSEKHNFDVIFLANNFVPKEVRQAATGHGFTTLSSSSLWSQHVANSAGSSETGSFQLSDSDPHLSIEANQVVADALMQSILDMPHSKESHCPGNK